MPIRAYGLMLWIALVAGLVWTLRAARRSKVDANHVVDIALYSLIAGIVSAHLASVLLDLPYYARNPGEILGLWSGLLSPSGGLRGLSFHGGLIGALIAALVYCRRRRVSFLAMTDLFSPGLTLGYAITRIGCLLNGCCYGIPTHLPWAIQFHVDPESAVMTPPSHPTQLYATAANLVIFGALLLIEKRRRFTGQVFISYLALYSVYRFLVEFLRRGVTADIAFCGLTQAQLVSLLVLAITVPILVLGLLRPTPTRTPEFKIRNPKSVIPRGG